MIALVEPLIPALRRYARSLLRDREDADDLVQDVIERALVRWHQRRRSASVRAWLFTILHNLAMDHLRQRTRRGMIEPIDAVPEAQLAHPARQEAAVARADILALVAALPEEQRSVLLLIAVEDLSYAEAATVLDVPQGTIMSRLARARERLRRMMEGESAMSQPIMKIVS
ncbi:sigma-70 family RNA polymerase sigma factor [uncultured Sphingosinicella sp.]|uniref:sigma-70 family RNA polymerase sigma factor n=1 Tax=uncultured Sphingosinicella sp. TaxID=478748 RepID=UPI0030D91396